MLGEEYPSSRTCSEKSTSFQKVKISLLGIGAAMLSLSSRRAVVAAVLCALSMILDMRMMSLFLVSSESSTNSLSLRPYATLSLGNWYASSFDINYHFVIVDLTINNTSLITILMFHRRQGFAVLSFWFYNCYWVF